MQWLAYMIYYWDELSRSFGVDSLFMRPLPGKDAISCARFMFDMHTESCFRLDTHVSQSSDGAAVQLSLCKLSLAPHPTLCFIFPLSLSVPLLSSPYHACSLYLSSWTHCTYRSASVNMLGLVSCSVN
jgi:hypothetical protein